MLTLLVIVSPFQEAPIEIQFPNLIIDTKSQE